MSNGRPRGVLITRPREDAADLTDALRRQGLATAVAPMMTVEPVEAAIDGELARAQAVLFTSRNGVRAFCRIADRRDLPVYAVGDSTAALARDSGFATVESAGGDSADLARLVAARLDPANGPLFHAAGETVAGDLAEILSKAGFTLVRRSLYSAHPAGEMPGEAAAALRDGRIGYVLFFSPRTARIFEELAAADPDLAAARAGLAAICLSEAVAAELDATAWGTVRAAAAPTSAALIETLRRELDGPDADAEAARPEANGVEPGRETGEKPPMPAGPWSAAGPEGPRPAADANGDAAAPGPGAASAGGETTKGDAPMTTAKPEPDQTTPPPVAAADRPRGAHAAVAWTLVVVLIALGAAYGTLPYWRDSLPPQIRDRLGGGGAADAELGKAVADLQGRADAAAGAADAAERKAEELSAALGGIRDRLAALGKRLGETETAVRALREAPATQGADPALAARLSKLEDALAATLEARSDAAKRAEASAAQREAAEARMRDLVSRMEGRLAEVDRNLQAARQAATAAGKSESLALAVGQLRDALDRDAPFAAELAVVRRLGAGDPQIAKAIEPLAPLAGDGVPTRAGLLARLPEAVDRAAAADAAPEDGDWIDRTVSRLKGFVTVRRIDGKGAPREAALARAQMAADRNDLGGAVAELAKLEGPAAAAVKDWLDAARSRLAAETAAAALNRAVLGGLAGGG